MMRGMAITETSRISENEDGSFAVPSQTGKDTVYNVRIIDNKFVCNCPDFIFRKVDTCKHGYACKFWIATNTYLQNKPKPKVFAEDSIQCDRCGSIKVICYGKNADKQIFYCKDCQHKFRETTLIKKSKYNAELVTLTLDLYFSGLSLRKIARNVNDHFDLELDYSTIYKWIKRYVPIISEYVNSLTPQVSKTWHADELFVNMRGGKSTKGKTTIAFLWNVMDRQTRFLIASKLTEDRESKSAVMAFQEAVKNAHGHEPYKIYTDSLKSYQAGVSETFHKYIRHVAKCGVNKPHSNNNRIERMNGTLRERVKVQRGWKTMKTPLAEGMRIQYNFVKPHMALDGKTPAQEARIEASQVRGNKWMDLLELATKK
jgi:transposase-like protein